MIKQTNILIVENNAVDIEFLRYELSKSGISFETEVVQYENDYVSAIKTFIPDIILSDFALPSFSGDRAFEIRKQLAPETPFIFVSGTIGEEKSVEYIKNGVTDYVLKDKLFTLNVKINRALNDLKEKEQKKKTEEELKKNEMLFRALIEKSTDMKMLSTIDGQFIYGSPSVTEILGYSPVEFLSKTPMEFIHHADIPGFAEKRIAVSDNPGASFFYQLRLRHKNGEWIWCEGTTTNMLHEPAINAMVSNFNDITNRKQAEEKLILANNRLRESLNDVQKIMDSSLDVICSIDGQGKFVKLSEACITVWGYRPEELVGKNFIDFILADDIPKTAAIDKNILDGTQVTSFENRYIHKNGKTVPMLWSAKWDAEEEIIYCIAKDVTEQKKAELLLKKSEAFNRGVLNSLSDHIAVIDKEGNIIAVNKAWKRFGLENGETRFQGTVEGLNYFNVCEIAAQTGDETAGIILKGMKDVIEGKTPFFYQEYPCHSPGKRQWFGMWIVKFEDDEPMVVVAHHDITERKVAEEHLYNSEARLKEAQTIAHIGNFEMNMTDLSEVWSDEMFNIFGIEHTTPSMALFLSFVHPDDLDRLKTQYHETLISHMGYPANFRFFHKSGQLRYGHTEVIFKLDEDGKFLRLFGIFQDVTERVLAELEREKLMNDLRNRNDELEQFAYVASHDLQEPLRMITSFMALLEKKYGNLVDEKGKQYIHFAVDGAKRMREIILDLLDFSRVGHTDDDKTEVDFNKLTSEILNFYKRRIGEVNGKITIENLPTLRTYKTPVRQVFQNLISNSLKYRKNNENPHIEISCNETSSAYVFSVKDNGIGIKSEYFDKIFIIFQRLHNKDEYTGTGMGLAIAKKIVESLGGKIWVESELDKGSTFYFTLLKNNSI